jgi:hypothetical protein
VALLPGKAAAKPAEVGPGGELRFAEGEVVTWGFEKPDGPLCVVEGPRGLVLARATNYDADWIRLESTGPVYLSIERTGKGTLATAPGGPTARVRLTVKGKDREHTIAPDSSVAIEVP